MGSEAEEEEEKERSADKTLTRQHSQGLLEQKGGERHNRHSSILFTDPGRNFIQKGRSVRSEYTTYHGVKADQDPWPYEAYHSVKADQGVHPWPY